MTERTGPSPVEVAIACARLAVDLGGKTGTVNAVKVALPLVEEIERLRDEVKRLREHVVATDPGDGITRSRYPDNSPREAVGEGDLVRFRPGCKPACDGIVYVVQGPLFRDRTFPRVRPVAWLVEAEDVGKPPSRQRRRSGYVDELELVDRTERAINAMYDSVLAGEAADDAEVATPGHRIPGLDVEVSDHVGDIMEALGKRGIPGVFVPAHVPTVWVNLADGSTLHIGDHDDNLRLDGSGGYCVYRDLDGTGVGGPANDGVLMDDPDATLAELVDRVVVERFMVRADFEQAAIADLQDAREDN